VDHEGFARRDSPGRFELGDSDIVCRRTCERAIVDWNLSGGRAPGCVCGSLSSPAAVREHDYSARRSLRYQCPRLVQRIREIRFIAAYVRGEAAELRSAALLFNRGTPSERNHRELLIASHRASDEVDCLSVCGIAALRHRVTSIGDDDDGSRAA